MSKNRNKQIKVSHFNLPKIEEDSNKNYDISENMYRNFCNKYLEADLNKIKSEKLKTIYEDGIELLNSFYITNKDEKINNFILEIQFITMKINSVIEKRRNQEFIKRNQELNKNLLETIKKAENLEQSANDEKEEVKHIKDDMKSITTTIISIVLAVSIIPTAIVGLEKVSADYILPFISTIILFGMVMIVFVYSIYQDKIKISTWIILGFTMSITVIMWTFSIIPTIKINKDINTNEIETENIQKKN